MNLEPQSQPSLVLAHNYPPSVADVLSMQHLLLKWKTMSPSSYNIFPLSFWKPPPGAKIQQVGRHWAAYQEHLKEQAAESSWRAQVEQYTSLLHNTIPKSLQLQSHL